MKRYILDREYPRLLTAFGVDVGEVLRKADLPQDTFTRDVPTMTASGYFAFMEAVGELAPTEDAAIRMSSVNGIEQFSPPIFASYCARDGQSCVEHLARYKRLIGPMEILVAKDEQSLSIEYACPEGGAIRSEGEAALPADDSSRPADALAMPSFLVQCEFGFLTNLFRTATRHDIAPLRAIMQDPPSGSYLEEFLRCTVEKGPRNVLVFSAESMAIPFISSNDAMWEYFEPELKRRLSELDADDTFSARVRSALMEALPAGEASADDTARRLGVSKRTLQRKLGDEGTSFQKQLNHTRELLAKHYLSSTAMRPDEIAYLLGYLELNSFLRAFGTWTGQSPSEYRKSATCTAPLRRQ